MYQKRTVYDVEIESVAYGGSGVGRRDDGKIIFVRDALPGELVQVREKKEKQDYVKCELVKVLRSSQYRQDSDCLIPVGRDGIGTERFTPTPGCVYHRFTYDEEIRVKQKQFEQFLGDRAEILQPVPSPEHLNYRNKITLHVSDDHGDITVGYKEEQGQEAVDMEFCPLANPAINEKLCELRKNPGFKQSVREGMTLTLRYTANDGVLYWRNSPPSNLSWLKEETVLGTVSVPAGSFFQVNPYVSDLLIEKVMNEIKSFKATSLVDLYCGCGLFSIAASKCGINTVTGLDSDEASINAAGYNAKQHGISEASFFAGSADKIFTDVMEAHLGKTDAAPEDCVLLIDPPRAGIGRRIRHQIKNYPFKGIIYISCAPDTLSRDIKILENCGFRARTAQMLDMFPRTSHFESLTILDKA